MERRSALVVGATGLIGKELVKLLLEDTSYDFVEVWVRKPIEIQHSKLHQKIINFDELSVQAINRTYHDVFCCLGTTIKKAKTKEQFKKVDLEYPVELAKLVKQHGVEHYLVISAIGADASSSIFYNQVKGKLEGTLQSLNLPRLSIFRPSILMGNREEFRLGERLGISVVSFLKFALVGKLKRYRGIYGKEVAKGMVVTALSEATSPVWIYESEEIQQLANREEL
ncbi:oxidoreductase [Bacillus carboniphilus]|uniref:Oxidoreductase n=1 Tax=Bacillus carboniphilus TaxID=86663 RepID=A0ABN0WL81_9BACI